MAQARDDRARIAQARAGSRLRSAWCDDRRRNQDGMPAAAGVLGNDCLVWSLKRPVRQDARASTGRLPDGRPAAGRSVALDRCVERARSPARIDSNIGSIRIAFGAMKRAVAKCGGNGIGVVAEHDDHLVANRADGVVGRGDKRFRRRRQLATALSCFLPPMRPPRPREHRCAGGIRGSQMRRRLITCGGHWAS